MISESWYQMRDGASDLPRGAFSDLAGVSFNEAQDNPYQPNLFYPGYEASLLGGEPARWSGRASIRGSIGRILPLPDGRFSLLRETLHRLASASMVERAIGVEAGAIGGQKVVDDGIFASTGMTLANRSRNLSDRIAVPEVELMPGRCDLGCALPHGACRLSRFRSWTFDELL